jgi:hypothetical protein
LRVFSLVGYVLLSNCVLRVLSLVVFVGEVLFPYLGV